LSIFLYIVQKICKVIRTTRKHTQQKLHDLKIKRERTKKVSNQNILPKRQSVSVKMYHKIFKGGK